MVIVQNYLLRDPGPKPLSSSMIKSALPFLGTSGDVVVIIKLSLDSGSVARGS